MRGDAAIGKPVAAPVIVGEFPDLDVTSLRKPTCGEKLLGLLTTALFSQFVLRILRRWLPQVRLGGLTLITRHDDVRELLTQDCVFQVEGHRIKLANGDGNAQGPNFLLGLQDDAAPPRCPMAAAVEPGYRAYQRRVMEHFRLDDLPGLGERIAGEAERILVQPQNAQGFDAVQDLITHLTLFVCREYYGLTIGNTGDFTRCAFVVSRWIFDPVEKSKLDSKGIEASTHLNRVIDLSLASPRPNSIAEQLKNIDAEQAKVILFGMVVALLPTSTMAAGQILQTLLNRPAFMERTRAAARSGNDDELKRCLLETMRFDPLLREPLRVCTREYTLATAKKPLKTGHRIIAVTRSAMMDDTRVPDPQTFNPNRSGEQYMLFGEGLHRCVGAPLAETLLVNTFKPLLRQFKVTQAKKLERFVAFPEHYMVNLTRA